MRIYLITHAHTRQMAGVAADAWRLSKRGTEQAEELAGAPFWSDVDRIVVSSEPKTWLTVADVAAVRKLSVWVDSRFDELRRSGWIENYAAQVAAVFAEPTCSVAGWESVESVRQRAWAGLADLQRRFAGEALALVGHGLCFSIVRATIVGDIHVDVAHWQRLNFASYATIEVDPPALISDFVLSGEDVR
jgi:broad specificity phosphatase PhoE